MLTEPCNAPVIFSISGSVAAGVFGGYGVIQSDWQAGWRLVWRYVLDCQLVGKVAITHRQYKGGLDYEAIPHFWMCIFDLHPIEKPVVCSRLDLVGFACVIEHGEISAAE